MVGLRERVVGQEFGATTNVDMFKVWGVDGFNRPEVVLPVIWASAVGNEPPPFYLTSTGIIELPGIRQSAFFCSATERVGTVLHWYDPIGCRDYFAKVVLPKREQKVMGVYVEPLAINEHRMKVRNLTEDDLAPVDPKKDLVKKEPVICR